MSTNELDNEEPDSQQLSQQDFAVLERNDDIEAKVSAEENRTSSQIDRDNVRQARYNLIRSDNEILITIGRMNPPTPGHALLIKKMMYDAVTRGLHQINIVLSHSVDAKKNILECEEKRRFLYLIIDHIKSSLIEEFPQASAQINALNVEIICMNDPTELSLGTHPILKSIKYILSIYGYPNFILNKIVKIVIGADRANSYQFVTDSLFNMTPSVRVEEEVIERPVGAMSGTLVRQLVQDNDFSGYRTFLSIMTSHGLREEEAKEIYHEIHSAYYPKTMGGGKRYTRKNRKRKSKSKRRITSKRNRKITKKHRKKSKNINRKIIINA